MKKSDSRKNQNYKALFLLLFSLSLWQLGAPLPSLAIDLNDRVVASVDREAILESELDQRLDYLRSTGAAANVTESQLLEQLISERLLLTIAREEGVKTSEDEIKRYAGFIAKQNNLSTREFYAKNSKAGVSKAFLHEQLKTEIIKQKLSGKLFQSEIAISQTEIDKFISENQELGQQTNRIKLLMLTLTPGAGQNSETFQAAAQKIQEKLKNRPLLFKKEQKGTYTDLGWLSVEDLNAGIRPAVENLASGAVSETLISSDRAVIFKVLAKTTKKVQSDEKIQSQAKEFLQRRKLSELMNKYIQKETAEKHVIERKL